MKIVYEAIGTIHSPFTELAGMPIQPVAARGVRGSVELDERYREGLADLDGFSHVLLLYHLHASRGFELRVTPFLDERTHGVFATRAPRRPNPIGLSVVRLVEVVGATLTIEGVDVLDGTPLLDLKPYVPAFDEPIEVRVGWLEQGLRSPRHWTADERFTS